MDHYTVETLLMAIEEHKTSHPDICHIIETLLACHLSRLNRFTRAAHALLSSADTVNVQTLRSALLLPIIFGQRDTIA